MRFLYAAYAVTWIAHAIYLAALTRGYKRAKAEMRELKIDD